MITKDMHSYKQRNVKLLRVMTIADSAIFLWPVVILLYYRISGSAVGAGVLLSARSIASAVGELPTGLLSDRFGRARTAQAASFFFTCSAVLTVVAWWAGFWVLLFAVIIQGLGEACESGNNDSLLFESSDSKETYQKVSTSLSTQASLAGAASAVIGGFVGAKSLLLVAGLSIVPRLVSLAGSIGLSDVQQEHEKEARVWDALRKLKMIFYKDRYLRSVVLGKTIADGFGEVSWQYRALFVQSVWPAWAIGLSMPISLTANALGGALYNKYHDAIKVYEPSKVLFATTAAGRALLGVAYALSMPISPIIIGIGGIFMPTNRATYNGLVHTRLHSSVRASGLSAASFLSTVLFSVTSIIFGRLIDVLGVQKTLTIVTLCAASSLVFYAAAQRRGSERV